MRKHYNKIISGFIALLMILLPISPTVTHQAQAQTQEMTITEILSELASVRTQEESETAIRHLLDKTGFGVSGKGSKYEKYVLTESEEFSELAKAHLSFLNNGSHLTIGDLYNGTKNIVNICNKFVSESENISLVELDEGLTELQSQATAALDDKEKPNNAFLIAIVAEGATIAEPIPVYDSTTVRSPVQGFLYSIWLYQEGTLHLKSAAVEKSILAAAPTKKMTEIECEDKCNFACLALVAAAYAACVYKCPASIIHCNELAELAIIACHKVCADICKKCITLLYFKAKADGNGNVTLTWETATEQAKTAEMLHSEQPNAENVGFNLYRARGKNGKFKKMNASLIPATGNPYSYQDTTKRTGNFFYKLEDVDTNGVGTMHDPIKIKVRH